ncbi:MAG: xanthine dehydrogenase family protein molybdopterin-binding subunit [Thermodesulfobacteriota bacterium]
MTRHFDFIGKSLPRTDGWEFASGAAVFANDISLPGMLQAKVLRSPHPHARIEHIDTTKAKRLRGVKAVLCETDVRIRYGSPFIKDKHVFAVDKVRYFGDEVAGVAAVDLDTAEEALNLIRVEYEELPVLLDPIEAMKPEAPLIHEDLMRYEVSFDCERRGNVCSISRFRVGDVEEGFKEADLVFENSFTTQIQHQAYTEPHSALSSVDLMGNINVWTTTQVPFRLRSYICDALGLRMNKVRIMTTKVGGGFGGKKHHIVPYSLLLARETCKPVKITWTREEEFMAANPRHAAIIKLKTGVKKDGTLTAIKAELVFDTGAYSDFGPAILPFGGQFVAGRYLIPHIHVDGYLVYTNKINCGAFRGFGNPQVTFACESQMDIIAQELSLDPLELRLKNAVQPGDLFQTYNRPFLSVAFREALNKAAEKAEWKKLRTERKANRGVGVAGMIHITGLLGSSALVKINEDGTAHVVAGSTDVGTGTSTAIIQIAAETLGLPPRRISLVTGDTDFAPFDAATVGSRVVYSMGNAVKDAALAARRQLLEAASTKLGVPADKLTIKEGRILADPQDPAGGLSVGEAASFGYKVGDGPILGTGRFLQHVPPLDPKMVTGFPWASHPFPNFVHGAQIAVVDVDVETGEITVVKMISVHDVGRAVNPMGLRGQLIGGLCQGLGYALMENLVYDEKGRPLTLDFTDYKIPRTTDIPVYDVDWVETDDPVGPFGAKGVGEPAFVPTAAAIANAVYDAIGVRLTEIPLTAEKVLRALGRI